MCKYCASLSYHLVHYHYWAEDMQLILKEPVLKPSNSAHSLKKVYPNTVNLSTGNLSTENLSTGNISFENPSTENL